jgi:aerobic carbon-monoxide dehydrogenase medium subunit
MQMPDITVYEPPSIREVCGQLRELGESIRILAGGTDILVDLKANRVKGVNFLVSLRRVPGLKSIEKKAEGYHIGTLATPNMALKSAGLDSDFPGLSDAFLAMAATSIRNMATIGGNITSGVPCSDLAPVFVALYAQVSLDNGDKKRQLSVEDFILAPRNTLCAHDEVLTHIILPYLPSATGFSYQTFQLRAANALAVASVVCVVSLDDAFKTIENVKIVLGAVAPKPLVVAGTSALLQGKKPTTALLSQAGAIARQESQPISDLRGSAEYRRELIDVLTRRALREAITRAGGDINE